MDQAPAERVVEQELVSSPSVYQTAFDAQAAKQAAIDARLKGIEGSLSNVAKKVEETDSSKAQLAAKLASLEDAVKKTAEATGKGEEALRAKLAALELEIRDAGNSTAGEEALRAKLAEFEANLRNLASSSNNPVVIAPASEQVVIAEKPTTVSIGVTRGTTRNTYEVPADLSN